MSRLQEAHEASLQVSSTCGSGQRLPTVPGRDSFQPSNRIQQNAELNTVLTLQKEEELQEQLMVADASTWLPVVGMATASLCHINTHVMNE